MHHPHVAYPVFLGTTQHSLTGLESSPSTTTTIMSCPWSPSMTPSWSFTYIQSRSFSDLHACVISASSHWWWHLYPVRSNQNLEGLWPPCPLHPQCIHPCLNTIMLVVMVLKVCPSMPQVHAHAYNATLSMWAHSPFSSLYLMPSCAFIGVLQLPSSVWD